MPRASARTREAIATRLGWDAEHLEHLALGSRLHDVGKVSIRPEVLAKPGRLDEAEIAEIRAHPVEGVWLIAGVPSLAPALPYVLFHHERWDGTGYPTRRAGTEIPIEGRVMAVADAFDAMTSARPYREAVAVDAAVAELRAVLRLAVRPGDRRGLRRRGRERRARPRSRLSDVIRVQPT